jgi:hypothetical protein
MDPTTLHAAIRRFLLVGHARPAHPPLPERWREGGVCAQVGMSHVPLPDLINAFINSGLNVDRVTEPREDPIPSVLAVKAFRT